MSLLQTKSAESVSLHQQKGGWVPEFWIDILQVPLEALAVQILPQVQSALDAEGDGGRGRHKDKTRLCHRQVLG